MCNMWYDYLEETKKWHWNLVATKTCQILFLSVTLNVPSYYTTVALSHYTLMWCYCIAVVHEGLIHFNSKWCCCDLQLRWDWYIGTATQLRCSMNGPLEPLGISKFDIIFEFLRIPLFKRNYNHFKIAHKTCSVWVWGTVPLKVNQNCVCLWRFYLVSNMEWSRMVPPSQFCSILWK